MDVQFTDREIDVMEVLWERGPSLVAEARAALRDELAYATVLSGRSKARDLWAARRRAVAIDISPP